MHGNRAITLHSHAVSLSLSLLVFFLKPRVLSRKIKVLVACWFAIQPSYCFNTFFLLRSIQTWSVWRCFFNRSGFSNWKWKFYFPRNFVGWQELWKRQRLERFEAFFFIVKLIFPHFAFSAVVFLFFLFTAFSWRWCWMNGRWASQCFLLSFSFSIIFFSL